MRHWPAAAIIGLALIAHGWGTALAQTPFRPVATVNKSLITAYDVDQRARILVALGAEGTPAELGSVALDQLIEDRLKLEAATNAGFDATPEVVAEGLAQVSERLGVSAEEFQRRMNDAGISDQALEDLVTGQMLWRDVVRTRFLGRIELGEAQIDEELALRAPGAGGTRYRFQEIGLPLSVQGRTPAETRALADELYRELSAGGDFTAAVRTYSRARSAEVDGDVGWVSAADLPPVLLRQVIDLPEGSVLPPQPVEQGITLLKLVAREDVAQAAADPELREQIRRDLLTERLDLLSQGLIQELRREAMIELR